MKVLWITNSIFPAPAKKLSLSIPLSGGWMFSLAENLSKSGNVELAVATIYDGRSLMSTTEKEINYFLLPCKNPLKYQKRLEGYWTEVTQSFNPDVVHIHGSEYPHGLACLNSQPGLNYIVSIQGILTVYERYYLAGLSYKDIIKNITIRDILRMDTLIQAQKEMKKRSRWEKEYFLRIKNIIGRTNWDKAHTKNLAPGSHYHFCNESLRAPFYTLAKWQVYNCRKHSIFLSQAIYPIKGLHQVLKAAALLISEFPDIHLSIAGPDITRVAGWKERIRLSGYGRYIRRIINRYNLKEHINFTGELSEQKMAQAYVKAHVFICPSSIENSPNSLGEAQILGVPCLAAYVGGIPDMIVHNETGILYRFEEIEMLADGIRQIFLNDSLANKLSKSEISVASERHNSDVNAQRTLEIYNKTKNGSGCTK